MKLPYNNSDGVRQLSWLHPRYALILEEPDGSRVYYNRDFGLHREDGPAVHRVSGFSFYYLYDEYYGRSDENNGTPIGWIEACIKLDESRARLAAADNKREK